MQMLRSVVFMALLYLVITLIGLVFLIPTLLSPHAARRACKLVCAWARWSGRWMIGLQTEVRGTPPTGEVLIAAKHQSFLDIMLIFQALPSARFIMKRELLWTPFIGLYAYRLGSIPVNRGKRGQAISKMLRDVADGRVEPGQLVIYPQGTRVAPDAKVPYKVGAAALYGQLGQVCVPVATNVGLFWPRSGLMRKPGLGVVEFLDPIEPGIDTAAFLARLEHEVETASKRLMKESGFDAPD